MRTLIFLALILLLLAMLGWVTFSRSGTKSSINLETNQIRHDTDEMVNSGKSLLHERDRNDVNRTARNQNSPVDSTPLPGERINQYPAQGTTQPQRAPVQPITPETVPSQPPEQPVR